MIVWDGGRCVEGFCLALPADVTMASDPDEYGLAYATVDEGIELGLIDGRVCSIRVSGSVFFEGDELIGDDLHRVAARLFEEITEEQELILPNGSMLTTVGGRRRSSLPPLSPDGVVRPAGDRDHPALLHRAGLSACDTLCP